jgi:hypothetical protein
MWVAVRFLYIYITYYVGCFEAWCRFYGQYFIFRIEKQHNKYTYLCILYDSSLSFENGENLKKLCFDSNVASEHKSNPIFISFDSIFHRRKPSLVGLGRPEVKPVEHALAKRSHRAVKQEARLQNIEQSACTLGSALETFQGLCGRGFCPAFLFLLIRWITQREFTYLAFLS